MTELRLLPTRSDFCPRFCEIFCSVKDTARNRTWQRAIRLTGKMQRFVLMTSLLWRHRCSDLFYSMSIKISIKFCASLMYQVQKVICYRKVLEHRMQFVYCSKFCQMSTHILGRMPIVDFIPSVKFIRKINFWGDVHKWQKHLFIFLDPLFQGSLSFFALWESEFFFYRPSECPKAPQLSLKPPPQ